MIYPNDREGMLQEYSEKVASECNIDISSDQGKMHLHFLRGYISQVIDRVIEEPELFEYKMENDDE